jgi:mannose-6-phosphate isomerase-like protein (cupin superfamily)
MERISSVAVVVVVLCVASSGHGGETNKSAQGVPAADTSQAIFRNYQDFKWNRILPDLGGNSPEICILSVDPKTQATKLMIRAPKGIHVRKHWHSANETHTVILGIQVFACEGKRMEQGPGSFNYLPAKMVHEAWLPAGSLVFITVDGAWDVNWVEGPPTAADLEK